MFSLRLLSITAFLLLISAEYAFSEPPCTYTDERGRPLQAASPEDVPPRFRRSAHCLEKKKGENLLLASPEDIRLRGAQVDDTLSTSLGTVHLRGSRAMEHLFGRTPNRAVSEASLTVSRAIRQTGWPSGLLSSEPEWKIVFLDDKMPETQIPSYLVNNCHPGWMVPPANIYIVSSRVAGSCRGAASAMPSRDADAEMMEVLLHEMGHVIEWYLLGQRQSPSRAEAEGFATWFEYYAGGFSEISRDSSARDFVRNGIEAAARNPSKSFGGAASDYMTAAVPFAVCAGARGIRCIADAYKAISDGSASNQYDAIQRVLGWNARKLGEEVGKLELK